MPEQQEGQQVDSSAQQQENPPAGGSRTYTQDELNAAVDKAVKERIDKQNAKHGRELSARDAENASLAEQVADLTGRLDAYEAAKVRSGLIKAVSQEAGVDAELLEKMAGDDEEVIRANAELLKAKVASVPKNPAVVDAGAGPGQMLTADQISEIKDPVERIRARAANKELYQ